MLLARKWMSRLLLLLLLRHDLTQQYALMYHGHMLWCEQTPTYQSCLSGCRLNVDEQATAAVFAAMSMHTQVC